MTWTCDTVIDELAISFGPAFGIRPHHTLALELGSISRSTFPMDEHQFSMAFS